MDEQRRKRGKNPKAELVFGRSTEAMKQCPYCLKGFRCTIFAAHLIACRNRDAKNLTDFAICPHDYTHHVRATEMKAHLDTCAARASVIMQEVQAGHGHPDEQIKELQEKLKTLQPEIERRRKQ